MSAVQPLTVDSSVSCWLIHRGEPQQLTRSMACPSKVLLRDTLDVSTLNPLNLARVEPELLCELIAKRLYDWTAGVVRFQQRDPARLVRGLGLQIPRRPST